MTLLYDNILRTITPTKKEIHAEKKIFIEIRDRIMKLEGSHVSVEWCGSSARNTHLRGDRDLDLFVMFDKKLDEAEMEKQGLRIGKAVFRGQKWEQAYSEHPYIRGTYKGFDVEIVPSYQVESGSAIKSAVDRTPFHNKYLLSIMGEGHRREARLLKQFMKGIDAYGADLKSCALPGYALELLIVHYGTFESALHAIATWTPGKTLLFDTATEKQAELFKGAPLIIIDPVDYSRNVASALSLEQFERMVYAAQKYLVKPGIQFFFPKKRKPLTKAKMRAALEGRQLIAIHSDFPKGILADIMWGQLRRFLKKIEHHLDEKEFTVEEATLWSDEKHVYFIYNLAAKELSKIKTNIGPLASDAENAKRFLEKKRTLLSGPRIEDGRLVIDSAREETNAVHVTKAFLKEIKATEKDGIKKVIAKAKVVDEAGLLAYYKGSFAEYLTRYVEGKEVFE